MTTEHLTLSPNELNLFNVKFSEVAIEHFDETDREFQVSHTLSEIKKSLTDRSPGLRMETVHSGERSCEMDPVTTGVCKWMVFQETGCVGITPGECLDITIAMDILKHRFPEELLETFNRIHDFLSKASRSKVTVSGVCN